MTPVARIVGIYSQCKNDLIGRRTHSPLIHSRERIFQHKTKSLENVIFLEFHLRFRLHYVFLHHRPVAMRVVEVARAHVRG
jgi:hypothetical protein